MPDTTMMDVVRFLRPSKKAYIFVSIFFLFVSFVMFSSGDDSRIIGIGSLVFAALILLLAFLIGCGIKKSLLLYGEEEICKDFQNARIIGSGLARLGQTHFYGKGGKRAIPYNQILRVYIYERTTNSIRNELEIKYVDLHSKRRTLCGLPLFKSIDGKNGMRLGEEIIFELCQCHPNIGIGK